MFLEQRPADVAVETVREMVGEIAESTVKDLGLLTE